ncbi:hypothetical protein [Synechococcus sp. CCY 9618]|uniref:hypothetical protein n=1 Tax=Synechococcus sp. CCY 9618 TaxID=2815602 RepID=UPI001C234C61|nr:hypothetical protein [Synechococcus sp. CCY 9618]
MIRSIHLQALCGGAAMALFSALLPAPARAHGIQSTLERFASLESAGRDERLELRSSFSSGVPASDAHVRLLPAGGGSPVELGITGADGRLAFVLPARALEGGEIQVDAGPGHRDYLEVSDLEPASPGQAPATHVPVEGRQQPWTGHASAALILIGLVSGAGLFSRLRRGA